MLFSFPMWHKKGRITCYCLLRHTHCLPSTLYMMSIAVLKVKVILCRASSETQWTIMVWYLTISTNDSCYCYQTRCRRQYYLPFSNTAHACTSAWCAQHSKTAAAQNSQLHFSWAIAPTDHSWIQLITRFREYTAAWIWAARNNWRNQAANGWTLAKQ